MFALMMSEDRVSMQVRRRQIIDGLRDLPGKILLLQFDEFRSLLINCPIDALTLKLRFDCQDSLSK